MPKPHVIIYAFAACSLLCSAVYAGGVAEDHGLADLIARLGAGNEPTGAGVEVAQVEASRPTFAERPYREFQGLSFTGTQSIARANARPNSGKTQGGEWKK